MKKASLGIVGARGYVGRELVDLVGRHEGLALELSTSQRDGASPEAVASAKLDAYVLALPNGKSGAYVEAIDRARPDAVIVDLSADHRFDDAWVYGQPERVRDRIRGARRIANPGCYATAMQLALGDSLAIALLEAKGFTAHDFKIFHPGGSLGAQLKLVGDIMHKGEKLPLVSEYESMSAALVIMTQKSFGCLGVVNGEGKLVGIVTDGDLRRHMGEHLLRAKTGDIMTRKPKTVTPDTLASAALELINTARITALFVVEDERPVGIVHVHDLLRIGVA